MSLKLKALKATIRAANRLRRKNQYKNLIRRENVKASVKADAKHTFKQKPKTGGGPERNPQISAINPKSSEAPINQKVLGATMRRMPYVGSRESWNAEMTRMYGGIHMSQDPKKIKKSVKLLTKKLKKKKIFKAAEGGEVVVHANVDRSLL